MRLLNVEQVAEATHRHTETITKALRAGELHGYQKVKRSPWVVEEDCALAWRLGRKCAHEMEGAA